MFEITLSIQSTVSLRPRVNKLFLISRPTGCCSFIKVTFLYVCMGDGLISYPRPCNEKTHHRQLRGIGVCYYDTMQRYRLDM